MPMDVVTILLTMLQYAYLPFTCGVSEASRPNRVLSRGVIGSKIEPTRVADAIFPKLFWALPSLWLDSLFPSCCCEEEVFDKVEFD